MHICTDVSVGHTVAAQFFFFIQLMTTCPVKFHNMSDNEEERALNSPEDSVQLDRILIRSRYQSLVSGGPSGAWSQSSSVRFSLIQTCSSML